jgi:hypothetical protein
MGDVKWPPIGTLVLVRWEDAAGPLERNAGDDDREPAESLEAETVGWISKRTRRNLSVACERLPVGYADRYRGVTRIPIGWVTEAIKIA